MLKRLRSLYGKLRDIPIEMRATRLNDAGHIDFIDALMLDGTGRAKALKICEELGVENVIAAFPMPMGLAEHFVVNGRAVPGVPMVTEERTVVAAASKAAKLCGPDGFKAIAGPPVARAHVRLHIPDAMSYVDSLPTPDMADASFLEIREAVERDGMPFRKHGGGRIVSVDRRYFKDDGGRSFARFTIAVTTGEAMGARGVTAYAKAVGSYLAKKHDWKPVSWICLNHNPHRKVEVSAVWPHSEGFDAETGFRITENSRWADEDPERSVTHNKGIMNAVDAIGLATGQDTRAIQAGFWADAYRTGNCRPLGTFKDIEEGVYGTLEMQLTVGTVGGATSHPFAQFARRLMGVETSAELMAVMGAVGLAQNFAALAWALDT